jgi:hypothetical protein
MAQVVECLPSKPKSLSSSPSTTKEELSYLDNIWGWSNGLSDRPPA